MLSKAIRFVWKEVNGDAWDVKNDLKRQFVSVSGFERCCAFKSEALILADEKEFPLFLSC